MRVTFRFNGDGDAERALVLRITLPKASVPTMTAMQALRTLAKQYESKYSEQLVVENFCLVSEGRALADDDILSDYVKQDGDVSIERKAGNARATKVKNGTSATLLTTEQKQKSAAKTSAKSGEVAVGEKKKVRCRNFGCNKFFDPDDNSDDQACVYHMAPPIFHETAKWWSCCPNQKFYDWDEFQKSVGCTRGKHSAVAPVKQHLGGTDLRDACAPKKLGADGQEFMDDRKRIENLRKAMIGVGVVEGTFDKCWGRLAASSANVVDELRQRCEKAMQVDPA